MAGINDSVTQNLLPVQAYFDLQGNFQTFIGQNQPFYATVNPSQSGLNITNSTIDSTIIGANSPSTGVFTNITTTTGSILSIPTGSLNIVNKGYVDAVATGLNPKSPAAVLAYNNITLSGLQTIDGYTTLSGDRVLVIGQTNAANNGIYTASSGSWTRTSDANTWALLYGAYVFIDYGTVYAGSAWVNTSPSSGTLGTTPITFVQFANSATYTAGTGLNLSAYQFSIANTGVTSGSFGSASNTLLATVNAQGQLTSLSATPIAITNTQVSGLGTMSTQNANNVAITGGTVNGTIIGNSSAAAITGTTITATSSFSGSGSGLTGTASGLSIGGSAASATTAGSVTNSLTFDNTGSGAVSGTTFNGSSAKTISYNTIGAPSTTGTNASGTWAINVSGNAATVTNGVYTTGSYSNPAWITSILGSIVSGAVASATTATNVAGGTTGSLLYQSAASTTAKLTLGTSGYILTAGSTAPQYVAQSTLSVGSASTATTSTNIANGVAGAIPYQSDVSTTGFTAAGTSGQVLTSAGTGTPTWTTPTSYATVTDDTTTNGTRYPLFANQTSGNLSTEYTSSTKLQYNPNTGVFTATGFSGSGASLTSLTAGNLSGTIPSAVLGNSSLYIGTTAILLNAASGSITSLAVNISGSAGSATTATTATNATNIAITDNTSSSSTYYPVLSVATTGNNPATTSSTQLSFVPSTGALTATSLNSLGTASLGTTSTTYVQIKGDAAYPGVYAAGGTNTPLVLQPLGTGALQAQATTSSTVGGNARGANAVDWQTSRNGASQIASGGGSFIGAGTGNTPSGAYSSVVGGGGNSITSTYAFNGGGQNNGVTGIFAVNGGGYANSVTGFYGSVLGGSINSTTSSSAVTTQSATMNGTTAVTLAATNANIKVGQFITGTSINYPNTYVAAISGTSLTLSQAASGSSTSTLSFYTPHGVVVGGGNNQATGSYSFIGGGGDAGTAANRNLASGDWSFVGGGFKNTSSGTNTFIGGGQNNTASASLGAILAGQYNIASGSYSSVVAGNSCTASGYASTTIGGENGTTRGIRGNIVLVASSQPIGGASSGANQSAVLVLSRQTTDATPTILCSDPNTASGTNQVILPNNSAYYFKGEVISGVTGGGNTKGWEFSGVIKRGAGVGTTTLVGSTVTSLYADAGASTWSIALTADTTNGGLAVTFTGQASTTIRTVCQIRTTEMTY
jgi:hypothetical protein